MRVCYLEQKLRNRVKNYEFAMSGDFSSLIHVRFGREFLSAAVDWKGVKIKAILRAVASKSKWSLLCSV